MSRCLDIVVKTGRRQSQIEELAAEQRPQTEPKQGTLRPRRLPRDAATLASLTCGQLQIGVGQDYDAVGTRMSYVLTAAKALHLPEVGGYPFQIRPMVEPLRASVTRTRVLLTCIPQRTGVRRADNYPLQNQECVLGYSK